MLGKLWGTALSGCGVLSLLLLARGACGATPEYGFRIWTSDQGLPQNTVNSILQTRDGYLWFTTFNGLVRYDGARFVVFDRSSSRDIPSQRFTALFEDREGSLWIGAEGGSLLRYRQGGFTSFTKKDGLPAQTVRLTGWRQEGGGPPTTPTSHPAGTASR